MVRNRIVCNLFLRIFVCLGFVFLFRIGVQAEEPNLYWKISDPAFASTREAARALVEAHARGEFVGQDVALVAKVLSYFNSSDRDIPASVLYKEAFRKIPSNLLGQLTHLDIYRLRAAFEGLRNFPERWNVQILVPFQFNKANFENLIKIQAISLHCRSGCFFAEDERMDNVAGLSRAKLDELVKDFPDASDRNPGEFNFLRYEQKNNLHKYVSEIDWYQVRVMAGFFAYGMHKEFRSTYQVFSRGTKNRAYIVAGGIDEIYDLLENVRFTEREIQFWKADPEMKMMGEDFWDYLRNWKFTGNIRAVKPGTVMFSNEPIMEITANPIDQHIIETLILPILNDGSKVRTKAARIKATTQKPFIEGGSRRGANDNGFSAQNGVFGGAAATSNIHAARLMGKRPVGFIPHSWFGYFKHEIDAMIAFARLYPEAAVLPDTFFIPQGLRNAAIANPNLSGVRPDSYLTGMDYAQTSQVVRQLLNEMGMDFTKISGSDRLNEYTISALEALKSQFDSYLVGTDLASPSDASGINVVDKNAGNENLYTGEIRNITKVSNSKPGIPGKAQVWRVTGADGKYEKDIVTTETEKGPEGSIPLLHDGMIDGKRVNPEIESVAVQALRTTAQVLKMPAAVQDINAQPGVYTVEQSEGIKARIEEIKASHVAKTKKNVGFVFLSADPATESHRKMVLYAKAKLNLDEVIVVPTGSRPVHKPQPMFKGEARAKMLEKFFEGVEGVRVDRTEVNGLSSGRTVDTMDLLKKAYDPAQTEYFMIMGVDQFFDFPNWKQPDRLISENNLFIAERPAMMNSKIPANVRALMPGYEPIFGSEKHFRNDKTGKVIYINDLHVEGDSSSQVREQIDEMDTVFHQVDTQLTFWEGMHGVEAGPLAVPGSTQITENVKTLAWIAKNSPRIKAIASKDAHSELEVEMREKFKNEFLIFARHGMEGVAGPVGDARIPEVINQFPQHRKLIVPNFRESRGARFEDHKLEEVPFDIESHRAQIMDPHTEIILHKNGQRSELGPDGQQKLINAYDFGTNKHAEPIIKMINPKRVFVYGVATDWCVVDAVMRYRKLGYDVLLVEDAVAHIFPKEIADVPPSKFGNLELAYQRMRDAQVKFVKTSDVVNQFIASIPEGSKIGKALDSANCPEVIKQLAVKK